MIQLMNKRYGAFFGIIKNYERNGMASCIVGEGF